MSGGDWDIKMCYTEENIRQKSWISPRTDSQSINCKKDHIIILKQPTTFRFMHATEFKIE